MSAGDNCPGAREASETRVYCVAQELTQKHGVLRAAGMYTGAVTVSATGEDTAGPSSSVSQFL